MERIEKILRTTDVALSLGRNFDQDPSEGILDAMVTKLLFVEDNIREQIQEDSSEQMSEIIAKLAGDASINQSEMQLIRLWMLRDAESYMTMENDFPNWLREFNRLRSVLDELHRQTISLEVMGKLSGTIRDILRVIADISFFISEKDRVKKFEAASRELSRENKAALVEILTQKLNSLTQ